MVWHSVNKQVRALIGGTYTPPKMASTRGKLSVGKDPDVAYKSRIEKVAIDVAWRIYEHRGYAVTSVEAANEGWDLTAWDDHETLRIEVKGTAHQRFTPELTPNEYYALRKHGQSYRLFLVTHAMGKPRWYDFHYNDTQHRWVELRNEVQLTVEERMGARLRF